VEILRPRKTEYEKIQRFLEDAYGHSFGYFPSIYPQAWSKENIQFHNIFLVKEKGAIVSLVRVFPLKIILGEVTTVVGGIGGVATAFSHRGRGYMGSLMQSAIAEMTARGYPFSILWGDRHRYNSFGYEIAGQVVELSITSRGLDKAGVQAIEVKKYLGQADILDKMYQCYCQHPFRKERTRKEFALLSRRIYLQIYYATNLGKFAYLILAGEIRGQQVLEWAGAPELVPGMLKHLANRFGISGFTFTFPASVPVPEEIFRCAADWKIAPAGMVKILDLKKTLLAYRNLLERKFPVQGDLVFGIKGKKPIRMAQDSGRISITEEPSAAGCFLEETEMVQLVFGTLPAMPRQLSQATERIARTIFPLPVFLWPLDHI